MLSQSEKSDDLNVPSKCLALILLHLPDFLYIKYIIKSDMTKTNKVTITAKTKESIKYEIFKPIAPNNTVRNLVEIIEGIIMCKMSHPYNQYLDQAIEYDKQPSIFSQALPSER